MPKQILCVDFIKNIEKCKPKSGKITYFDTDIKGFLLELRSSGTGTFYFRYRDKGTKVCFERLGRLGEISVQEARAKAYELWKILQNGQSPRQDSHRIVDMPTVKKFAHEQYMPYARTHKRSWKTDAGILKNHILPRFGEKQLHLVRRADVVTMQKEHRQNGLEPATCNRILMLLKFMFSCAIRWEILPAGENPCTGVASFPISGGSERFLTRQEAKRLLHELDVTENVQIANIIRMLLFTGARKSEILLMRWEDCDLAARVLKVPLSKSNRVRYIPLSDAAIQVLRSIPRKVDIPWVFFNPKTGKPKVYIYRTWDRIRKKVGISDMRLHDLRHSFASFLVRSGRSLYEVQQLLGHHDPKITMRYAHLSPKHLVEAANVVGKIVTSSG